MAEDWRRDLEVWLAPFLAALRHKRRVRVCPAYIAGLIGRGERKSVQPMAARGGEFGYDQLHHFVADGGGQCATRLRSPEGGRSPGRRRGWISGHRRHGVSEEGATLGWCGRAICLVARQDVQLPVAGLGDPGFARGAGDGGSAALPARELDG